jgi:hypothetical protein
VKDKAPAAASKYFADLNFMMLIVYFSEIIFFMRALKGYVFSFQECSNDFFCCFGTEFVVDASFLEKPIIFMFLLACA